MSSDRLDMVKNLTLNAIEVGMDKYDAYIFGGATPDEIEKLEGDKNFQIQCRYNNKKLEHTLLTQLDIIREKQTEEGSMKAVVWSLEHLYDRYYRGVDTGASTGNGTINIHFNPPSQALEELDTVAIHEGCDAADLEESALNIGLNSEKRRTMRESADIIEEEEYL